MHMFVTCQPETPTWTHAVAFCEDVGIRYFVTFDCIEGAHYVCATMTQEAADLPFVSSFISQYMPQE